MATKDESAPVQCEACGYRASLTEWAIRGTPANSAEADVASPDPDRPPSGTRITRRAVGAGGVAWEIPPSGRSGGLMVFSVLWLGFVTLWTGVALAATVGGAANPGTDSGPTWLFPLFSLPFWAVGIGMLYGALRGKYARHLVVIDGAEVVLVRSMFQRAKRKALSRAAVEEIAKREFYRQNYRPVHGVEVRGSAGKLRFGTTLTEEEKDWLVADMRRVFGPVGTAAEALGTGSADGSIHPAVAHGGPAEVFSVEFPPVKAAGAIAGNLVGAVVIGVFLAVGIFGMKDAGFFRWIWLGMSSLFGAVLLISFVNSLRSLGVVIRVSGDRGEIVVQRRKGYRVITEERMARAGVEVRMYETGSINQTRMAAVELVGGERVLKLARWYPAAQAEPVVGQLRGFLGAGGPGG